MMMDYITLAGFILAVFGTGVAVGKIVEKIERLERKKEDEEHKNTCKNDRHQYPARQGDRFSLTNCKGLAVYRQQLLYNYSNISESVIQV